MNTGAVYSQAMKLTRLAIAAFLILSGAGVHAQTPDSYTFRAYGVGATQPIQTPFTFQAGAVACNQDPPAAPSTVNPTRFSWDDRVNAGKVCIWTDPGTGPLFSAPIGTIPGSYEGTLTATANGLTSLESARAPFSRAAAPSAPGNFRIYR